MPSGPSGRGEESVQFSLKELLKLEDERLEEQHRAAMTREAALARQREDDEKERRAAAEASARAEAEHREAQRKTELDELARREAMQKAIAEQSRLEVEVRARADERERERAHELAVERLRNDAKRGQRLGPLVGAAAMGGVIMFAVMLTIELGVTKPAAEHRIAEAARDVIAAETRSDDLARQLNEQRRLVGERDRQLADTRTELEALKAKKTTATSAATTGAPKLDPPRKKNTSPADPGCVDPHDPMCFSLKTIPR